MAKPKTNVVEEVFFNDAMSDTKTLQEIFDLFEAHEESLKKLKIKNDRDVVNAQAELKKKKFLEIQSILKEAELNGVIDIANLKKKLEKEAIKEEEQKRLEMQLNLYKKELDLIKKKNQSLASKLSNNESKWKENQDVLDLYESIVKSGGTLTVEQQQDKATKEAEQKKLDAENLNMSLIKGLTHALQGLSDSVNGTMKTYVELQKGTNARLQGFDTRASGLERALYGKQPFGLLENRLTNAVGVTPYFKTETMLTNLSNLINEGIASNVEQRAFLQTASENIANTFDVANSALLRIIRLQQSDSSAARLGMEAYLTKFLNGMFENTEYLNQTFDNVTEALLETYSHMSIEMSTELEYIIQKWLGALVSVGMSDATATNIAQALGYLGSGNVEALSQSNLQNLLVMAASKSNLSYADLLTSGLNASDADVLLNNLVAYMVDIERSGNNVVKSQFANTFGLSFSDLAAAANLASSMGDIYGNTMSFGDMYSELKSQLNAIPGRMNMALMLDTLWENLEFGVGSNIASNPALAALWKVTDLIQQNTGGINIPSIMAMGSGIDLNATVENLIKLGFVGVSSLGMIGDLVSGIGSTFGPSSILGKLGIASDKTMISRGSGLSSYSSGLTTSLSTVQQVAQGSGEDIYQSSLAGAKDEAKESPEAAEDDDLKYASLNIYKYLTESFDTKMDRLIGYVDEVEAKLVDIERKMLSGGGIS